MDTTNKLILLYVCDNRYTQTYYLPISNVVGHSHLAIVNFTITFIYGSKNTCINEEFIYAEKPSLTSSVPGHPVFVVRKNRQRRPGASYYVICGMDDVTVSRHKDMFILMSLATEKLQK